MMTIQRASDDDDDNDDSSHQVHATVPLTDAESICIISVGPLPYVLYTAGKLVRIIEHGQFHNMVDIS